MQSALHNACMRGNDAEVMLHVEAKANLNVTDTLLRTPCIILPGTITINVL